MEAIIAGAIGIIVGSGIVGVYAMKLRGVAQDLADDNGLTMVQGDILMDMAGKALQFAADAVEDKNEVLHDVLEQAYKGWMDAEDGTDDLVEANIKLDKALE